MSFFLKYNGGYLLNEIAAPELVADWIAQAGVARMKNCHFYARKCFTVKQLKSQALLSIVAESRYHLFVNGIPVGHGPVRGIKELSYYDTYDISSLLQEGENWLAAHVHCDNIPNFQTAPIQPALKIMLA